MRALRSASHGVEARAAPRPGPCIGPFSGFSPEPRRCAGSLRRPFLPSRDVVRERRDLPSLNAPTLPRRDVVRNTLRIVPPWENEKDFCRYSPRSSHIVPRWERSAGLKELRD